MIRLTLEEVTSGAQIRILPLPDFEAPAASFTPFDFAVEIGNRTPDGQITFAIAAIDESGAELDATFVTIEVVTKSGKSMSKAITIVNHTPWVILSIAAVGLLATLTYRAVRARIVAGVGLLNYRITLKVGDREMPPTRIKQQSLTYTFAVRVQGGAAVLREADTGTADSFTLRRGRKTGVLSLETDGTTRDLNVGEWTLLAGRDDHGLRVDPPERRRSNDERSRRRATGDDPKESSEKSSEDRRRRRRSKEGGSSMWDDSAK